MELVILKSLWANASPLIALTDVLKAVPTRITSASDSVGYPKADLIEFFLRAAFPGEDRLG